MHKAIGQVIASKQEYLESKVKYEKTTNKLIQSAIESSKEICKLGVPLGEKYFDETKLKNFHFEKFDHIYDIQYKDNLITRSVFIVGRVDYHGKPVFIELAIKIQVVNEYLIDDSMWGHVLISTDANAFVKSIVDPNNIKRLIESMGRDGIKLDEDIEEYCHYYSLMEKNIHPFEDMCVLNIDDFKRCIYSRKNIIPDSKIDGFIEFLELQYHYEEKILDDE